MEDIKQAYTGKWKLHSVHGTKKEARECHLGIVFDWKITQKTINATAPKIKV